MPFYNKLLKIKKPMLIDVGSTVDAKNRFRILYPNGNCEYSTQIFSDSFTVSCFVPEQATLKKTVEAMQEYDQHSYLQILEINYI